MTQDRLRLNSLGLTSAVPVLRVSRRHCPASSTIFWETGIRKFRVFRSGPSHIAEDDLEL